MKKAFFITLISLLLCASISLCFTSCDTNQDAIDRTVTPIEDEITAINGTIKKMQEFEKAQNKDIEALEKKATELENGIKGVEYDFDNTFATIQADLTVQIVTIKAEIEKLKSTDAEINTSINSISDKLNTIESAFNVLTATVNELQKQADQNEKDISELEEKITALEGRLNCFEGKHVTEEYTYNNSTHSRTCTVCNESFQDEHTPLNGACICGMQIVAQVNDTYYSTLSDALTAWTEGTTLTLHKNLTDLSDSIQLSTKDLTLDLNGYTLDTINNSDTVIAVTTNGKLTIKDSKGNGIIDGEVYAWSEAELYLESGTISTVFSNGDFYMSGGRINGKESYGIYMNASDANTVISGGEVHGGKYAVYCYFGSLTVKGTASLIGKNNAINTHRGSVQVNGGTFSHNPTPFVDTTKYAVTNNQNGTWTVKEI